MRDSGSGSDTRNSADLALSGGPTWATPVPAELGKRLIVEAWEKVRANNGAPGVDAVSTGLFEEQLKGNLYKL